MTTTQRTHTPGPWEYALSTDKYVIRTGLNKGAPIGFTTGAIRVAQANARLIAAAPELLEALQYLIQGRPGEAQFDRLYDARVNAARAAIAKATA